MTQAASRLIQPGRRLASNTRRRHVLAKLRITSALRVASASSYPRKAAATMTSTGNSGMITGGTIQS
ncbi:MAG: hypothetical protein ACT4OC_25805, partial [Bradyrhizobium sp.]